MMGRQWLSTGQETMDQTQAGNKKEQQERGLRVLSQVSKQGISPDTKGQEENLSQRAVASKGKRDAKRERNSDSRQEMGGE